MLVFVSFFLSVSVTFCPHMCNYVDVLCCSVAFHSASSCVDDLDESRSLQLKSLLSEYFDKRRDRTLALAPVDLKELDKYKVKHTGWLPGGLAEFES